MYAVIDLETTGLNPWRHDRIVEIAIVHVDDAGHRTREWCTLVNPHRDLGPQHIHGIRAADARRAPTFAQLAPQIVELLRDRVLVAHNVAFDGPFLDHQFALLGARTPIRDGRCLCTMMLAADYLPGSGRSLAACCAAAGIRLEHAHCALDDARAAADLLGHYIRAGGPAPWADLSAAAIGASWPDLAGPAFDEVRRGDPGTPDGGFLTRLVEALPRVTESPAGDAYLAMLDRALIDRRISATEADALVALAVRMGLDRATVTALHEIYLTDLAQAALEDGAVSDAERADLRTVATLLGLAADPVASAQPTAAATGPARSTPAQSGSAQSGLIPRPRRERFLLRPGDRIVFTGASPDRERCERRAGEAGLVIDDTVSADVRVVVAADPDTMSAKARKAHKYGIPVVDIAAFGDLLAPNPR